MSVPSRTRLTRRVPCPATPGPSGLARAARWGVVIAASMALVACASSIAGSGTLDPAAKPGPAATLAAPSPSNSPSASTVPSVAATGGPTSFQMLRFDLPVGWRAQPSGSSACLNPDGAPAGSCTLLIVDLAAAEAEHHAVRPPDPQGPQGWWMGAGPPTCRSAQPVPVTTSTSTGSTFVRLRNKTAAYGAWQVTCADPARNFSPRLWWLPRTRVAFLQEHGNAGPVDTQINQIMASVEVVE